MAKVLIPLYILGSGLSTVLILLTLLLTLVTDEPFLWAAVPGLLLSSLMFVFSVHLGDGKNGVALGSLF